VPSLQQLAANAAKNGVADLEWLDRKTTLELEPELKCVAAVLSPSTGIVDSHRCAQRSIRRKPWHKVTPHRMAGLQGFRV
jgi:L-2-hydroxyglutarate oxidase LhgO